MIDEMLVLINKFGLSHVCGNQIFDNIEKTNSANHGRGEPFNFPYLDTYLSFNRSAWEYNVEFYLRGQKDHDINFRNIFEYLLSTTSHGQELNFFYIFFSVKFSARSGQRGCSADGKRTRIGMRSRDVPGSSPGIFKILFRPRLDRLTIQ